MAEAKEKRVRKPRRNFEKELAALKLYCEVSIEVLTSVGAAKSEATAERAQIETFERVLAKINNGGAQ